MTIKLSSVSIIKEEDIPYIVNYYNSNKPEEADEILPNYNRENRLSGFDIDDAKTAKYHNVRISISPMKKIRFSGKYLVSYNNHRPFEKDEEILLYQALSFVLGKENVNHYKSYSDAILCSPSYTVSFMGSNEPQLKRSPIQQHIQDSSLSGSFRRIMRLPI